MSSQALTLLNSDFVTEKALALAARAQRESPADPPGRALALAFGRAPSPRERELFAEFLARQTAAGNRSPLADLCHMLLGANEFAYLD